MMRRILLTSFLVANALIISAIPAKRGIWRTITTKDGTQMKVELRGNEYKHYWQSEDGQCFTKDTDGQFVRTELETIRLQASNNKARIQGSNGPLHSHVASTADGLGEYGKSGMGSVNSLGEVTIPVILVNFADVAFKEDHTIEKMNRYFNEENYSEESGCVGSARDYFVSQSFGLFKPSFPVIAQVTLDKGYAEYGENNSQDNDKNVMAMVREAIAQAVQQGVDFSQYYVNNSVPLVSFIYAGKGEASGGDKNTIWPHQLDLNSYTSRMSGYAFKSYFVGNELDAYGSLDGIGTFCHEFGHGLGLPDFYCTNYSYDNESAFGNWSIMDSGCYLNNGRAPIGYTAYERSYLGWLHIPEVTEPQGVVLGDPCVEGSVPAVLFRNPANEKEYFIFENRQIGTWYFNEQGSGLMVSRFSYSRDRWNENTLNNVKDSKRAMVVTADNAKLYYSASQSNLYGNNKINVATWTYYNKSTCEDAPIYKVMKHNDRTVSFNFKGNDLSYTYKPEDGAQYVLVENADLLEEGDTIIIVNKADYIGLGKIQTTEARLGICINELNDTLALAEDNIQDIVLKKTSTGSWGLMVNNSYLTAAASGTKLNTTSKPGNNAVCNISITDGNALIAFQTKNVNRNIRYDVASTSFCCYYDEGDNVQIYRKVKVTDGIRPVLTNESTSTNGIYTITGQKVNQNQMHKGIYIINGKKVVVK